MQSTLDFDQVFSALADATRRDIVRRAIDAEEGVAELAGHYPMSFAAVQKHVAILERAGLVTKRRLGRRKVVRTNPAGLLVARRLLDQYEELWRGRIHRMTELVSQAKEIRPRPSPQCARIQPPGRWYWRPNSTYRPIASGSYGPIRASSSAGGDRRPIPPRSIRMTSRSAAGWRTT
jgi:DNA-binding transcriptional ArsR family regulator